MEDKPASDDHREALITAVESLEPSRQFFDELTFHHLTPGTVVTADLDREYVREVLDQAIAEVETAIEAHPEGYQPVHDSLLSVIDYHANLFDYFAYCQMEMLRVGEINFYEIADYNNHAQELADVIDSLGQGPSNLRELQTTFNSVDVEHLPSPRSFERGYLRDSVPLVDRQWNYLQTIYELDREMIQISSRYNNLGGETDDFTYNRLSEKASYLSERYESLAENEVDPHIRSRPSKKAETAQCLANTVEEGSEVSLAERCNAHVDAGK